MGVKLAFDDHRAGGLGAGIFELFQFGQEEDVFEQLVDALAGFGGNFDQGNVTTITLDIFPNLGKIRLDLHDVGLGQVNFVDGDNIGNAGGLDVLD